MRISENRTLIALGPGALMPGLRMPKAPRCSWNGQAPCRFLLPVRIARDGWSAFGVTSSEAASRRLRYRGPGIVLSALADN